MKINPERSRTINLAKSAGFCFGVKRALDIALRAAKAETNVYMLGDIVHNDKVVREIEKSGARKISRLSDGRNKTLLVPAHGTSLKIMHEAKMLGYRIIDATCPMVKEIHRIVRRMEKNGFGIIVIGDKKHDEVRGILGQLKKKGTVLNTAAKFPLKAIKKEKKYCVVVQSTQNMEKTLRIVASLKKYIRCLKFFNTICHPTRAKQEEVKRMPQENQVMVIIGSRASANTRRLYEISKSINPYSYWVHSPGELKQQWFKKVKTVGVTAGASTPESTIKSIIAQIKKIA